MNTTNVSSPVIADNNLERLPNDDDDADAAATSALAAAAGFEQTALSVLLHTDSTGVAAWITERGELPPVRQKFTCLLHETYLLQRYQHFYETALDIEAEATWTYLDMLCCRACRLTRIKRQERSERQVAVRVASQRRALEEEERFVRSTLQDSHLQAARLLGRNMLAKRSLLSGAEYKAQQSRVARHVDSLLSSVQILLE